MATQYGIYCRICFTRVHTREASVMERDHDFPHSSSIVPSRKMPEDQRTPVKKTFRIVAGRRLSRYIDFRMQEKNRSATSPAAEKRSESRVRQSPPRSGTRHVPADSRTSSRPRFRAPGSGSALLRQPHFSSAAAKTAHGGVPSSLNPAG